MIKVLRFIWELPQNIVGIILLLFYKANSKGSYKDRTIRQCTYFPGGISLGSFIFINKWDNIDPIKHEYGHSVQSKYLGPLYLFVIGIPSALWATIYGKIIPKTKNGYYKFYTEKWADKLGNIIRK